MKKAIRILCTRFGYNACIAQTRETASPEFQFAELYEYSNGLEAFK